MGKYQQNIENARRVGVIDFLQTCRPGELIRVTDKEYRTKTHSSLVISSNGLFHWFSMGVGGNGRAIFPQRRFARKMNDMDEN